jgi:hypothetical protein
MKTLWIHIKIYLFVYYRFHFSPLPPPLFSLLTQVDSSPLASTGIVNGSAPFGHVMKGGAASSSSRAGILAEHLRPHTPKVLPTLERFADSSEEADRSVVAECLGHLLLVSPTQVG